MLAKVCALGKHCFGEAAYGVYCRSRLTNVGMKMLMLMFGRKKEKTNVKVLREKKEIQESSYT